MSKKSTILSKKTVINLTTKNNRIIKRSCKQDLLMRSLIDFFNKDKNTSIIVPIITGKSNISLRLIDWFVTNYCKKSNVRYSISHNNGKKKEFNVHVSYKIQLKSFSKKQFDPFRRDERIVLIYGKNKTLITTVGQLNFFRWVIKNNILDYIKKHYNLIEKDMNEITKKNRLKLQSNRKKSHPKKRRQLSLSATKHVNKHETKIVIDFS